MQRKARLVGGVIAVVLCMGTPMHVSADWIKDFYNSAGAGINVTPAQAIATQNVVGGSGGGLTWRVPNRSFHPVQITPPSFKSGCGGIDIYLGGYSFPNKEQFVQALRNFGQASLGFFFQMALKSMAPEIGATLDVINEIAQRVNQFGTNSCEAGEWAAGEMMKLLPDNWIRDGSGYAQRIGAAVDWIDATQTTKAKPFSEVIKDKYLAQYNKAKGDLTDSDIKTKEAPPEYNLVWYALLAAPTASSFTDADRELIMSLVGAEFIVKGVSGTRDGGSDASVIRDSGPSPTITFEDLVGYINGGASSTQEFKVLQCAGDTKLCLQVTTSSHHYKSFAARAEGVLEKLMTAVVTRQPHALTSDEQQLLRLTSQPLMKVASLATGTGIAAHVALSLKDKVAYAAAIDAASGLVLQSLTTIEAALQAAKPRLNKDGLEAARHMENKLIQERQVVLAKLRLWQKDYNALATLEQLQKAEVAMYSNLNRMLAANSKFMRQ